MLDFTDKFSEDVGSFFRSPVREIFKRVDLNSIYSFAGGYPSAETFPLEEIRRTMSEVIDKYAGKAFQYGATQGVPELREAVAKRYDVPVERVQITSSSQQGIDVCTRVLVNPGDVMIRVVEDMNNNGKWDTGDFGKGIQPEKVFYYNHSLELRAMFEYTQDDWDINAPLNEQKPLEITKQKPDKERKKMNRNATRKFKTKEKK